MKPLGSLGVGQLVDGGVQGGEALLDRRHEVGVDLGQALLEVGEGLLRPFHVGGHVEQVDVRVALLLAGDLAAGGLVEQADGAVGEIVGLQPLEPVDQLLAGCRRR